MDELNGIEIYATNMKNAYLEAYTKEKVCFIAGKKFGNLEGHLLIIDKALYEWRPSGLSWHDKFTDFLNEMGFKVSKAEPEVLIRLNEKHDFYEYIAVYVDDLAIASKKLWRDHQISYWKIKLQIERHWHYQVLSSNGFFSNKYVIMCISPKRC